MRATVADQVFAEHIDGETVLLDLRTGRYFGLDQVAARLWELLMELGTTQAVVTAAAQEYDVSHEQLAQDLDTLVRELAAHDLIILENHATPTAG